MSGVDREERPEPGASAPWSPDAGPEPGWADAIRRGRKARGDRLRAIFDTFGDDDPTTVASSRPPDDGSEDP